MDVFTIELSQAEVAFIRQALDLVNIAGKDAKFLAGLQMKIETEMAEIQKILDKQKPSK